MKEKLIQLVEQSYLRNDIPEFKAGDTIAVYYKVVEGNKERVQLFEGVVIRVNGGGIAKTFTIQKSNCWCRSRKNNPCKLSNDW